MTPIGSYDYHNLICSYLAQDRPSASTAQGRLSYNGFKLYSYSSVLALISSKHHKTLYLDKYIQSYSNTTTKQTRKLINAAYAYSYQIFTIDLDLSPADNLIEYWDDITDLVGSYKRSRKFKRQIKLDIQTNIRTAQRFAELHELDPTIPDELLRILFVNQLLN